MEPHIKRRMVGGKELGAGILCIYCFAVLCRQYPLLRKKGKAGLQEFLTFCQQHVDELMKWVHFAVPLTLTWSMAANIF